MTDYDPTELVPVFDVMAWAKYSVGLNHAAELEERRAKCAEAERRLSEHMRRKPNIALPPMPSIVEDILATTSGAPLTSLDGTKDAPARTFAAVAGTFNEGALLLHAYREWLEFRQSVLDDDLADLYRDARLGNVPLHGRRPSDHRTAIVPIPAEDLHPLWALVWDGVLNGGDWRLARPLPLTWSPATILRPEGDPLIERLPTIWADISIRRGDVVQWLRSHPDAGHKGRPRVHDIERDARRAFPGATVDYIIAMPASRVHDAICDLLANEAPERPAPTRRTVERWLAKARKGHAT